MNARPEFFTSPLAAVDAEVFAVINAENQRQEDHIELIASENYTSKAVMEAQGSQLTNKYAEGYPGRRYYGGCEYVDVAETLAIERLKTLFGAKFVNVQPHSGAQANTAVYFVLMQPGDAFLGLSLAEGGHLTHGMALNMSGKWFKANAYGLTAAETIDYDAMRAKAHEVKPKMIIGGGSAYSLKWDWAKMREIAQTPVPDRSSYLRRDWEFWKAVGDASRNPIHRTLMRHFVAALESMLPLIEPVAPQCFFERPFYEPMIQALEEGRAALLRPELSRILEEDDSMLLRNLENLEPG